MPDDESAEKLPNSAVRTPAKPEPSPEELRELEDPTETYGYGGGFEHDGKPGYEETPGDHGLAGESEDPYQTTGGFGHEAAGYSRDRPPPHGAKKP